MGTNVIFGVHLYPTHLKIVPAGLNLSSVLYKCAVCLQLRGKPVFMKESRIQIVPLWVQMYQKASIWTLNALNLYIGIQIGFTLSSLPYNMYGITYSCTGELSFVRMSDALSVCSLVVVPLAVCMVSMVRSTHQSR